MDTQRFMARAIELSRKALATEGTAPFGAVVVKNDEIVGEGFNHARARHDPTAHGEIEAIRDACRRLGCIDLTSCELYTSCEPCALCVAAMHVAGIRKVHFAASLDQSASVLRDLSPSVRIADDCEALRAQAGSRIGRGTILAEQHMAGEAVAVLEAWAERHRDPRG